MVSEHPSASYLDVPTSDVSSARLHANRLNARKSTGPRTPEGKARSAQNAFVHGLRAATILAPGEDPRELAGYRISIIRSTNPRNALEMEFVEQIIRAGWKLRRYQAAEIKALASQTGDLRKTQSRPVSAAFVLAHMLWSEPSFAALARYEQQYVRMMDRAVVQLRKLQNDPIHGSPGDFAGEMIAAEEAELTGQREEEENAPNEANPESDSVTDAPKTSYATERTPINADRTEDEGPAALVQRLKAATERLKKAPPAESGS